ncbi:FtsQ-type POTRA domain-containing protein [Weissella viridescens]|uniref:Cell division protein DivIB n=1 Tax=Weissella viridescens TaxID=1629 RepID=A0A3P2RJW8_WEIVI|nr:cell division protein FtsQ/DivIB [Weissella viridescens]RRG18022.1 FtsQ-type POTRA domain-containing protein [Weissella viridescens]
MTTDDPKKPSTADIQKHLNQLTDGVTGSSSQSDGPATPPKHKAKTQSPKTKKHKVAKQPSVWQNMRQSMHRQQNKIRQEGLGNVINDDLPEEIPDDIAMDTATLKTPKRFDRLTRNQWQGLGVMILFIFLALVIGWLVSPAAQVQRYQVVGNDDLTANQVLQAAQLRKRQSTFLTANESSYFQTNAKKANPQIKSLTLTIKNPTTIQVQVKEHPKVGYLRTELGYQTLLDNGDVIGEGAKTRPSDQYAIYEKFPNNQKELKKVSHQVGKLNGPIRRSISDVVWSPTKLNPERLMLFMNDGNEVLINASDVSEKLKYYPSIAAQFKANQKGADKKKTIIDLQVGAYGYQQDF